MVLGVTREIYLLERALRVGAAAAFVGNDASWVTVVDVCRGSLVRARVWAV